MSGGGASDPRSGPAGVEARRSSLARRRPSATWPSSRTISAARSASSLARDPERDRAGAHVGRRVERHVLDVDLGAAERERDLGDGAGPVLDPDPQLAQVAAVRSASSSRPAVVARRRGARRRPRRRRRRGSARAASRRRSTTASISPATASRVGGEDVRPDRRVGARRPGSCRESWARPRAGARTPRESAAGGLLDEHVREHVRQVADRRHHPVVGLGVDRLRAGAELGDRALQAVVVRGRSSRSRRGQVPARSLEQVGAGVLDPGGLGARERVPADEALDRRRAASALDQRRAWSSRRR